MGEGQDLPWTFLPGFFLDLLLRNTQTNCLSSRKDGRQRWRSQWQISTHSFNTYGRFESPVMEHTQRWGGPGPWRKRRERHWLSLPKATCVVPWVRGGKQTFLCADTREGFQKCGIWAGSERAVGDGERALREAREALWKVWGRDRKEQQLKLTFPKTEFFCQAYG